MNLMDEVDKIKNEGYSEARRATQDIDLDFIRYSISEESIKLFVEKLNCLEGIQLKIASPREELNHQDYKGKSHF